MKNAIYTNYFTDSIKFLRQNWHDSTWVNVVRTQYIYAPISSINDYNSPIFSYKLENNYPNPFNPSTTIVYTISERCKVSLKIFNVLGSEIAELINGEMEAGEHIINFIAINLSSGVYFYRMQAGSYVETKKMILLK